MATTNSNCTTIPEPISVLVAEDDIDDQELLAQALYALDPGIIITFITNGNKFRRHLEELGDSNLPRVILLDYNLPELNGVEILKFLSTNERYRDIPKMVWSTSNSGVFRNQSIQFGAVEYIVKPINFDSFTQIALKILSYA
jgi:CheY-like chemotaxis protein